MVPSVQAASHEVVAAIRSASARTGSDFDYLLGTAIRESGLRPEAASRTSSASGLFQFIDQTWLGAVKQHGGKFGLGGYAQAIEQDAGGRYVVSSRAVKAEILSLRKNPELSALMAGATAEDTRSALESRLGRSIGCGELYAAHFLGESGACKLISMAETNPSARADLVFPQAAQANRNVFYHADGTAKTVADVYAWATKQPTRANALPHQMDETIVAAGSDSPLPALDDDAAEVDEFDTEAAATPIARAHVDTLQVPVSRPTLVLTPAVIEILSVVSPALPLRRQI